jgi:type II secretory pathway component GspD/PulD (secretin)
MLVITGINRIRILAMSICLLVLSPGLMLADIDRADMEKELVSIAIDEGRVIDVLKLLAAQHGLNLSVSSEIEGDITITLVDVALTDALDVITSAASANWYIAGSIVVVKPIDRLDLRELETKLFRLQYLSALEAKKIVLPLLPDGCEAEILSRKVGNEVGGWDEILEVRAYPSVIHQVSDLINQIDIQRILVEIEVKIIETSVTDDSDLGIDWPDKISLKLGDLDNDELGATGIGSRSLGGGDWTWGRMTIGEVSLLLNLLQTNGRSKLISNPRVTTLSNERATIEVSTTIPVETLNRFSEGGIIQDIVSFQDLDVSIDLSVTPRVADDSTITLEVISNVEEITGYVGPEDNQRPVTSRRSVTSSVIVKSNESLGLGGLMKEVEHKTVKKFPILGSIPIIGRIFQHHIVRREKADLLILITPRIVESSLAGQ